MRGGRRTGTAPRGSPGRPRAGNGGVRCNRLSAPLWPRGGIVRVWFLFSPHGIDTGITDGRRISPIHFMGAVMTDCWADPRGITFPALPEPDRECEDRVDVVAGLGFFTVLASRMRASVSAWRLANRTNAYLPESVLAWMELPCRSRRQGATKREWQRYSPEEQRRARQ